MPRPRTIQLLALILVVTFAIFSPSLSNGFSMDDAPLAESVNAKGEPDPIVAALRAPWWYFGQRYWAGSQSLTSRLYRPVTILSYALTYNLICAPFLPKEWEAFPHHLLNILLHCLAVWLVWIMLRDLACGVAARVVGAGMFGCHAIHTEVVAGIVGRAELFAFVFGAASTLLFARGRTWLAAGLMFAAFCAKESALAWAPFVPCFLLAVQWRTANAKTGTTEVRNPGIGAILRPSLARWILMIAGSAVPFFILRSVALSDIPPGNAYSYLQNPLAFLDAGTRVITGIELLGYGLYKCVVPLNLYCLYGPGAVPIADSVTDPGFLGALVVLTAWLGLALRFARRWPLLFLSAAIFLGFAFITSNIPFATGTIFGERLYYIPSLGICLLGVLGLESAGPRCKTVFGIAIGVWCVGNAAVAMQRSTAFRDSPTLFLGDVERLPESADLQAKAGFMIWKRAAEGEDVKANEDAAYARFQRSVEIDEDIAASWASMARIHQDRQEWPAAARLFKRALDTRFIQSSGVENRTIEDYLMVLVAGQQIDTACDFARQTLVRLPAHHLSRLVLLDHGASRIATNDRATLLAEGLKHWPDDPYFVLLRAMLAYETVQRNRAADTRIAMEIQTSMQRSPATLLRKETRIRARLYLGDTLAALGNTAAALKVFGELLNEEAVIGKTRRRLERQIAELERR